MGTRTVLGFPNWGYDVVAITTPIQNNSGRPEKLARRPVAT